jgi:hypothetical protein
LDFDEIFINKHENTLRIIQGNYFEDRTFENKFSKKEWYLPGWISKVNSWTKYNQNNNVILLIQKIEYLIIQTPNHS